MIKQLLAGVALAAAALCGPAQAQGYPSKPVNIVVPFAPGGATDIMTRLLAERLSKRLGQPVIVENKPGAGTMIASEYVAKAPADGHTVLMAASSLGIAPSLYSKVNYDPVKSFAPISLVASVVHVLEVHPSVPVKSVGELITWLKANPGKANYGSVGAGTSTHLESELFNTMAGVKMVHVPYKGSAPALTDLVGGSLQVMFDAWASSGPFVKDGRTRLLAVTTAQRSKILPDVPTVAESGYKGFDMSTWYGLLMPAGAPAPIVAQMNGAVNKLLATPEMQKAIHDQGAEPLAMTPEAFSQQLQRDYQGMEKIVRDAGVKIE